MSTKLMRSPTYTTVRSGTGLFAADSATLSDANYPVASAIEPYGGSNRIAVYWYANAGTVGPFDFVDLQLLFRDAKDGASGRWTEGPIVQGVLQNQAIEFATENSTQLYIRIHSFVSAAAQDIRIRATSSSHAG